MAVEEAVLEYATGMVPLADVNALLLPNQRYREWGVVASVPPGLSEHSDEKGSCVYDFNEKTRLFTVDTYAIDKGDDIVNSTILAHEQAHALAYFGHLWEMVEIAARQPVYMIGFDLVVLGRFAEEWDGLITRTLSGRDAAAHSKLMPKLRAMTKRKAELLDKIANELALISMRARGISPEEVLQRFDAASM